MPRRAAPSTAWWDSPTWRGDSQDQDSWSEDASAEDTAAKCARNLAQVVHPACARVRAEFFRADRSASRASVERDELRVRTVFALHFDHIRTDNGEYVGQDAVHAAFNTRFGPSCSPARPLDSRGSTSIRGASARSTGTCRGIRWVSNSARSGFTGTRVMPSGAMSLPRMRTTPLSRGARVTTHLHVDVRTGRPRARGGDESDLVPHWIAPRLTTGRSATCRTVRTRRSSRPSTG